MRKGGLGLGALLATMLSLLHLAPVEVARADALTDLDHAFVDTYTLAAEQTLSNLRSTVPVFVVRFGQIALYRPGIDPPDVFSMDMRQYSEAKAVAHSAATLYVGLAPYGLGHLDSRRLEWLAKYQLLLEAAEAEVKSRENISTQVEALQTGMLADVRRFAQRIQQAGAVDQAVLDEMGSAVRAAVRQNLDIAAASQLEQFRSQVARWREAYPALAWDRAVVTIVGIHQARDKYLQRQFFDWMLHDAPSRQDHVVIDETMNPPPPLDKQPATEALTLLSMVMMDKGLSEVTFGDPLALQWDVLGDAAEAIIKTWPPSDLK